MQYRSHPTRARKVARAWKAFAIHLAAYVVVNGGLVALNLARSPQRLWCLWPLLGWGVGLLAHGLVTFAVTRQRTPGGARTAG